MGPQFFETRMGQKFFEYDLPRLIGALVVLSEKIEAITKEIKDQKKGEINDKGN